MGAVSGAIDGHRIGDIDRLARFPEVRPLLLIDGAGADVVNLLCKVIEVGVREG